MRHMLSVGIAVLVAFCFTGIVQAAENVDGTWEWTIPGRDGGQGTKASVKLKAEGEKLTGAFIGRDGKETPIEEGTVKGNEISFNVTRTRGDQKMVIKYTGKVEGDTIKGKSTFKRGDQEQARDWEAKRAK